MQQKDDYAFPRKNFGWAPGMELRDWFAGMALQGIMSAKMGYSPWEAAKWAYGYADAMIEERNKEQN